MSWTRKEVNNNLNMSSWSNKKIISNKNIVLEPLFSESDKKLFYTYLDNTAVYFEYGSGGSTYKASLKKNILKIYSVESDLEWHNKLKKIITNPNVVFIYNNMNTQPNTYGHPGPNCTKEDMIKYSSQITFLNKAELSLINFILIDGRFRVASCLKCHRDINAECIIAFDDFLNRPQYHVVLDYYNIIDKGSRMVFLKKKLDVEVPNTVIEHYEVIAN
jgi:hypothetical protein